MLLWSQTCVRLHACEQRGVFGSKSQLANSLNSTDITLSWIVGQILQGQKANGSWDNVAETTAMAVLSLAAISCIPSFKPLRQTILRFVKKGQEYVRAHSDEWSDGRHLWIEKVAFTSPILCQAYCLAAANVCVESYAQGLCANPDSVRCSSHTANGLGVENETCAAEIFMSTIAPKLGKLVALTRFGSEIESPLLSVALLQSFLHGNEMKKQRAVIFPRSGLTEDKYLDFIPFIWTICIFSGRCHSVSPQTLNDMIDLSMFNYQIDEYMEVAVESQSLENLASLKDFVHKLCGSIRTENGKPEYGSFEASDEGLTDVKVTITHYVTHVLGHSRVIKSVPRLRTKLIGELKKFLVAHITQAEDNYHLRKQIAHPKCSEGYSGAGRTYYHWVKGVSTDHTSCPFSFVYFLILISPTGKDPFPSARQQYLMEDLYRHLGTMCRQYNDYGSIARDRAEGNLNSINFPEFATEARVCNDCGITPYDRPAKAELMFIAEYERMGLERAFSEMSYGMDRACLDALRLFINVTDLFGEVYVQKDIASRKTANLA